MGFLAPKDLSANPAPVQVYNWRIYFLAISAAMGSSMFGYDSAFIGGTMTLPSFRSKFGLAEASPSYLASLRANIVSTFQAGCFFGVLFCYSIVERLGMKWTLVICGAVFNIGAILQIATDGQLGLIYAGRVLTGRNSASLFRSHNLLTQPRSWCWRVITDCTCLHLRMLTSGHPRSFDWHL